MMNELMCAVDFVVMGFYAVVIYKFSVQDIHYKEKPLALLSSKLRL